MPTLSAVDLEDYVRRRAPEIASDIRDAAERAHNEAALVAQTEKMLEKFARNFDVQLHLDRERTLINGRADAVYNRFVIEYEPPRSITKSNAHRNNRHAIRQVQQYMEGLERLDRHKKERLAGAVLDGGYFIFIRYRDEHWYIDDPVAVDVHSTQTFLRYLLSLSTELALTPENLVRDFGENSNTARRLVPPLYNAIRTTESPKAKILFQQWQRQFREVSGYDPKSGQLDTVGLARLYAVREKRPDLEMLLFALHTYYAAFIKLLALQVATYYLMPKVGTGLAAAAGYDSNELQGFLAEMERGGLFAELGIRNFLEGDFFGWYLDVWDEMIDTALRRLVGDLANYSLVTLDVDPEETRDLLKHLYQNLMPRKLRHALGEYYTPDWLAERLLNQLGYEGDPSKRILDPACGSGTFPVLALKRARRYADAKMLPPTQVLEQLLNNVVGFDLNPLAVISSRTNYLLALGDLLLHRVGDISIPIYLADSILTPSQGADLFSQGAFDFNTAVGRFSVPKSLVQAHYIDKMADLLEESVHLGLHPDLFRESLLKTFPFDPVADEYDIGVAVTLYVQLLKLEEQGINGIWARIIKNAFAPLFQGKFDYVAGNPPWINWANLPAQYRQETSPLWLEYELFPHKGLKARLGSAMDDISVLLLYIAADKYLKTDSKLGFVITQTIFKTEGGGAGFRHFKLGSRDYLRVLFLDDMSSIQLFDGATNHTSVVIIQKGQKTVYPVPVSYWRKEANGMGISTAFTLEKVTQMTRRLKWSARPVDSQKPTSPWIIGREKAINGLLKCLGNSPYQARYGVHTHGNGIYWLDVIENRPGNLVMVSNMGEVSRPKAETIQATIEKRFVYPLLRGREVRQWKYESKHFILLAQDSAQPSKALPELRLSMEYPETFAYLKYFESLLRERSGFKQFFDPQKDPFYSVYNVGEYTFSPYKCAWREQSSLLTTVVIGPQDGQVLIPDHKLNICPFDNENEAHFVCACLANSISQFLVKSYTVESSIATHILNYLKVPKFDSKNAIHQRLAELSMDAHFAASNGDSEHVHEVETQIDESARQLWGLTNEELKEIVESLDELS